MSIIVDGLTEFGQRFARKKAGDACRQPTQTRKQAEATLERAYAATFPAYAATFPEYDGTSWAEAAVRLKEVECIHWIYSTSFSNGYYPVLEDLQCHTCTFQASQKVQK
ncbi:hypothetical protein FOL46_005713 [Perkinsus olseni]|uniref:Uncharacterized protein n=1 Tax=Perkinsus olseni TaxID=32597 RepID=A0A7J6LQK5_PEROL|nr:hypothetical protein FOL46_005713 [Perkinsus olseni]